MKEVIEPWLKSISGSEPRVMWEEYISRKGTARRMTYNIFESANYLMTLFLMVIAAVILWLSQPLLIFILCPLFLVEICIAFKGLSR